MDLTLPIEIRAPDGSVVGSLELGAAEGVYLTLRMFKGDIINVRNVQGGTTDNPNLDLGAGSSTNRGDVVFNWDVGNGVAIYNGRKKAIFEANRHNDQHIHSRVPHRFHHGALILRSDGKWHKL